MMMISQTKPLLKFTRYIINSSFPFPFFSTVITTSNPSDTVTILKNEPKIGENRLLHQFSAQIENPIGGKCERIFSKEDVIDVENRVLSESSLSLQKYPIERKCEMISSCKEEVVDESRVLSQLSLLLPIQKKYPIERKCETTSSCKEELIADGFLSAEDKLRGVFIQKLNGKAAVEQALTNVGVELSNDVVANVLNKGNLGGEAMVLFFNWAVGKPGVTKDIGIYRVVLRALGRRKFFKYMMDVFGEIGRNGITPDLETLGIVLDSYARARHVFKALQLFARLEDYNLKCDTEALNVMLQCLCRRSHVSAANSLVNKMKGKVEFDVETYNIVIGGWAKVGKVCEIERVLKEMVENGLDPDSCTFSYVLEGLGRAGQIDAAVEIFHKLGTQEGECARDTAVFNTMIVNFISVGDLGECLKYYGELLNSGSDPNMDTYVALIHGFLKVRKVADAIEMFDEMLSRGIIPPPGTITSFIEPLCSFGPPHAAMMIYKKSRDVGCKISLNAYKLLLMRLSRFGKCNMLSTVWNEMQESGYSANIEVYEYVINGFCNIGHLENASLVMEECLQKGLCPSRLICGKLSNRLLASNKVEKAYKLLLKIIEARRKENIRNRWRLGGGIFELAFCELLRRYIVSIFVILQV